MTVYIRYRRSQDNLSPKRFCFAQIELGLIRAEYGGAEIIVYDILPESENICHNHTLNRCMEKRGDEQ